MGIEENKKVIFKAVEGLSLTAGELHTIDFICCNEDISTICNIASIIKKAGKQEKEEPIARVSAEMIEKKEGNHTCCINAHGSPLEILQLLSDLAEELLETKSVPPNMLLAVIGEVVAEGEKNERKR